ncbi:MAG: GNAT family N-acetyltransferase [Pseudomonadota bacterium]|nr:GNAT family N-acetyltransferase [Pseudomonadota bacterium]
MTTALVSLRQARVADADALAAIHAESWRSAYQGILPHLPLQRMIARRGPGWWHEQLGQDMSALVVSFEDEPVGYATFGRARLRGAPFGGEIFELYVSTVFQGLGFGKRLFEGARQRLEDRRLKGLLVWAIVDNPRACNFYLDRGGRPVAKTTERFADVPVKKVAFGWR